MSSNLETKFSLLWLAHKGPKLTREFKFLEDRRFKFDFVNLESKTAVEIEGGTWGRMGHSTGTGINRDCEKYNLAAMEGWAVVRLTTNMLTKNWIEFVKTLIDKRTP